MCKDVAQVSDGLTLSNGMHELGHMTYEPNLKPIYIHMTKE